VELNIVSTTPSSSKPPFREVPIPPLPGRGREPEGESQRERARGRELSSPSLTGRGLGGG